MYEKCVMICYRPNKAMLFFFIYIYIVKQCPVKSVNLGFCSTQTVEMTFQWLFMLRFQFNIFLVSEKYLFFSFSNMILCEINAREQQRGNQDMTIQRI